MDEVKEKLEGFLQEVLIRCRLSSKMVVLYIKLYDVISKLQTQNKLCPCKEKKFDNIQHLDPTLSQYRIGLQLEELYQCFVKTNIFNHEYSCHLISRTGTLLQNTLPDEANLEIHQNNAKTGTLLQKTIEDGRKTGSELEIHQNNAKTGTLLQKTIEDGRKTGSQLEIQQNNPGTGTLPQSTLIGDDKTSTQYEIHQNNASKVNDSSWSLAKREQFDEETQCPASNTIYNGAMGDAMVTQNNSIVEYERGKNQHSVPYTLCDNQTLVLKEAQNFQQSCDLDVIKDLIEVNEYKKLLTNNTDHQTLTKDGEVECEEIKNVVKDIRVDDEIKTTFPGSEWRDSKWIKTSDSNHLVPALRPNNSYRNKTASMNLPLQAVRGHTYQAWPFLSHNCQGYCLIQLLSSEESQKQVYPMVKSTPKEHPRRQKHIDLDYQRRGVKTPDEKLSSSDNLFTEVKTVEYHPKNCYCGYLNADEVVTQDLGENEKSNSSIPTIWMKMEKRNIMSSSEGVGPAGGAAVYQKVEYSSPLDPQFTQHFVILPKSKKTKTARLESYSRPLRKKLYKMFTSCKEYDLLGDLVSLSSLVCTDLEGWLMDMTCQQKRWCIIVDMLMCVFLKKGDEKPLFVIMLPGNNIKAIVYHKDKDNVFRKEAWADILDESTYQTISGTYKYQFIIESKTSTKAYAFAMSSQEDLNSWVSILKMATNLDQDIFTDSDEDFSLASDQDNDELEAINRTKYLDTSRDTQSKSNIKADLFVKDSNNVKRLGNNQNNNSQKCWDRTMGSQHKNTELNSNPPLKIKTQSSPEVTRVQPKFIGVIRSESWHIPLDDRQENKKSNVALKSNNRIVNSEATQSNKAQKSKPQFYLNFPSPKTSRKKNGAESDEPRFSVRSKANVQRTLSALVSSSANSLGTETAKEPRSKSPHLGTRLARSASFLKDRIMGRSTLKQTPDKKTHPVLISGYLYLKQTIKWTKYWCVISGGSFRSYKGGDGTSDPIFSVNLKGCTFSLTGQYRESKGVLGTEKEPVFKLIPSDAKTVYLSAQNETDFTEWEKTFRAECCKDVVVLSPANKKSPRSPLSFNSFDSGSRSSRSASPRSFIPDSPCSDPGPLTSERGIFLREDSPSSTNSYTPPIRRAKPRKKLPTPLESQQNHLMVENKSTTKQDSWGKFTDAKWQPPCPYNGLHQCEDDTPKSKKPQRHSQSSFTSTGYSSLGGSDDNSLKDNESVTDEFDLVSKEDTLNSSHSSVTLRSLQGPLVSSRYISPSKYDTNVKQVWKSDKNYQLQLLKATVAALPNKPDIFNKHLPGPNNDGLMLMQDDESEDSFMDEEKDEKLREAMLKAGRRRSLSDSNINISRGRKICFEPSVIKQTRNRARVEVPARDLSRPNIAGYIDWLGEEDWKNYWCVVKDGSMYLYTAPIDDEAVDYIQLQGVTAVFNEICTQNKKQVIEIVYERHQSDFMSTETDAELFDWLETLNQESRRLNIEGLNLEEALPSNEEPSVQKQEEQKRWQQELLRLKKEQLLKEVLTQKETLQRIHSQKYEEEDSMIELESPTQLLTPTSPPTPSSDNQEQIVRDLVQLRQEKVTMQLKLESLQKSLQVINPKKAKKKFRFSIGLKEEKATKEEKDTCMDHPESQELHTRITRVKTQLEQINRNMEDKQSKRQTFQSLNLGSIPMRSPPSNLINSLELDRHFSFSFQSPGGIQHYSKQQNEVFPINSSPKITARHSAHVAKLPGFGSGGSTPEMFLTESYKSQYIPQRPRTRTMPSQSMETLLDSKTKELAKSYGNLQGQDLCSSWNAGLSLNSGLKKKRASLALNQYRRVSSSKGSTESLGGATGPKISPSAEAQISAFEDMIEATLGLSRRSSLADN